ncbi:hypothetical protein [Actinoplanes sp. CA-252034]|uniref:hypothetical protein n=1 Tax=Actinoplanes sp. CA-252034 TaxID=3239906 RepID=UPI003D967D0A
MNGHALVEEFMEVHDLQWNRVPDDDPPEGSEARSDRQLKTLLWAGLRATATLCLPLATVSGPWQVLDGLGADEIVAVYAAREEEDNEAAVDDDAEEVHFAGASHLLIWLAIRHPELLKTRAAKNLIAEITEDTSAFHQIFYATMVMAGHQTLEAALAQQRIPARIRPHIDTYAAALAETERNDSDNDAAVAADAYDQMHTALEDVLAEGPGLAKRIKLLLATTGTAVRAADNLPASTRKDPVATPRTITYYLLINPSMHSATVLHRDDDDEAIRTTMLCLAAQISPLAAADLSAEFPGLTGDDPRLEPAARTRATRWIQKALQLARQNKPADFLDNTTGHTADARTLLNVISAREELPPEWPVQRIVAAAAYTAAAILHASNAIGRAAEVFTDD